MYLSLYVTSPEGKLSKERIVVFASSHMLGRGSINGVVGSEVLILVMNGELSVGGGDELNSIFSRG